MSHVAVQESKPGEPVFTDIACLKSAAEMLGGRLVERSNYKWYGRSVGDYALPKGMQKSSLGHNAKYVIELTAETKAKNGTPDPYEIGIVEDVNNPGSYIPVYDHWQGGHGLDKVFGAPVFDGGKLKTLLPKLQQFYAMHCDRAAAIAVGDHIEFLTLAQAHEKYPALFPTPTKDEDNWVSVVDTVARVGV